MVRADMVGDWHILRNQMKYIPFGLVMVIVLVLVTPLESGRSLLEPYSISDPGDIKINGQGEEEHIRSIDLAPLTYLPVILSQARPVRDQQILVGAGDIADCRYEYVNRTADLLDSIPGAVFTTGDNAYEWGTTAEFQNCYEPFWGRHKTRTRPAPGNHDYVTQNATGYFGYFGAAASDPDKGYYSYNLGDWHIVVLNSNCSKIGGCGLGSDQDLWLRADLAANPSACTLAYWHHPRFSSGLHGSEEEMLNFWQALYDVGVDVVLNGHDHHYERFAPQDPQGKADLNQGIRQFTVGTGGRGLTNGSSLIENSEIINSKAHGVLKLILLPVSYEWSFIPIDGQTFTDQGSDNCH